MCYVLHLFINEECVTTGVEGERGQDGWGGTQHDGSPAGGGRTARPVCSAAGPGHHQLQPRRSRLPQHPGEQGAGGPAPGQSSCLHNYHNFAFAKSLIGLGAGCGYPGGGGSGRSGGRGARGKISVESFNTTLVLR